MEKKQKCNLRQKTVVFLFAYPKIKKQLPLNQVKRINVYFQTSLNELQECMGIEYELHIEGYHHTYVILLFQPMGSQSFMLKKIKKNDNRSLFKSFVLILIKFFKIVFQFISQKIIKPQLPSNQKSLSLPVMTTTSKDELNEEWDNKDDETSEQIIVNDMKCSQQYQTQETTTPTNDSEKKSITTTIYDLMEY